MASAISGRSRPPLFTTGPATRQALAAAGALGATTGTVVHLPVVPSGGSGVSAVLAHELVHTRSPVSRPRFLLDGGSGLLDDDEREALAAGRNGLTAVPPTAGIVDESSAAAGIVERLPVGGGLGAVGDVAARAARAVVLEASAGRLAAASGWAAGADGPLAGAVGATPGAAGAGFGGSGTLSGAVSAGFGGSGAVSGVGEPGFGQVGAAGGAFDTAFGGVGGVGSGATATAHGLAAGGMEGAGGPHSPSGAGTGDRHAYGRRVEIDPDRVVEIVEERLLREIERRGGRWQGVF